MLQILPSDLCSDEEFVRRVYLDVIGALPTAAEAQSFLARQDIGQAGQADRRAARAARIRRFLGAEMGRPAAAAQQQGDPLRRAQVPPLARGGAARQHALRPVRADVAVWPTAARSPIRPANYFRTAADTNDCTETTSQLFLGIRIQCAKCHNHPFERWTQDNYYGIGAFFNRVQRKPGINPEEQVDLASHARAK